MNGREQVPSKTAEPNQAGPLTKLKQYKEIIAIIVFFLSGVAWIYGSFATKKQVDRLECFTNLNITLVRSMQDYEELSSKMQRLIQQLQLMSEGNNPMVTSDNKTKLEMERDKTIQLRNHALNDYHDALKKLESSNACK